jgi:hypothetical protein
MCRNAGDVRALQKIYQRSAARTSTIGSEIAVVGSGFAWMELAFVSKIQSPEIPLRRLPAPWANLAAQPGHEFGFEVGAACDQARKQRIPLVALQIGVL